MKGKINIWSILVPAAILFIIIILVAGIFAMNYFKSPTRMYFNAGTDVPNSLLYLKANNSHVNQLEVGKEYEVMFTVIPASTGEYLLLIDSDVYQAEKGLDLVEGEKKAFTLKIVPEEDEKWVLDNKVVHSWNDEVTIPRDSWLAGKRDYAILMNNNTLPSIVMEDYHLPISNNLSMLGEVYHVNLDLNELGSKPFEKSFVSEEKGNFRKSTTTDTIKLSVNSGNLILDAERVVNTYVSDAKFFRIRLYAADTVEVEKDTGFRKPLSELSFEYQLI